MSLQEKVVDTLNELGGKIDGYKQQVSDLQEKVKELEAKNGRRNFSLNPEQNRLQLKNVFADWIKSEHKSLQKLQPGLPYAYEVKDAGTMLTSTHLTGDGVQSYVGRPTRSMFKFHFRNILPVTPVSTGLVNYPQEPSPLGEGSFGKNTEGSTKQTLDYDIVMAPLSLKYIAGKGKVSREMLQDLPFLQNYLSMSLTEDFLRSEDQYYYASLIYNCITGSTSETNAAAKVIDYVVQVENAGHYPNAIVTSPAGWSKILKTKPNDYSIPGGVKFSDAGDVLIAGIPVYKSPLLSSTAILVGDFTKATIAQAESFNIRTTEFNSDDFDKNLISFRAEARCDVAVLSPKAFCLGTI